MALGGCPETYQNIKKENNMAVFKCEKCGATKEGRCKPKKCPDCAETGTMAKQEDKKTSGCGCACSAKK
jgi:ABC-type ATPase with predicted acetyltransferase domain